MPGMSNNYSDLAAAESFLAGRDTARSMRDEGVAVTADDAETWCPRGLYQEGELAWLHGWRSAWA